MPAEQLPELVTAWRELRHPRLAELIDRVSARLLEGQKPIKGKSVPARVKAVIEACATKNPLDVGRVLAAEWPGTWQHALPMLVAILTLPDDPRVARELARQVDLTRYETWTSAQFYRPLFRRLNELGDARQLPLLEAQLARTKSHYYQRDMRPLEEHAAEVHRKLVVAPLSAAQLRSIEAMEAAYAGSAAREKTIRRSGDELIEAVYANPDELGAKVVYGDWLTENGDPRGELISLQLAAPSEKSERRQAALIKKHWKKWLGPLADWFPHPPRFEAGFPVSGRIEDPSYRAAEDAFQKLLARREWCTFRSLTRRWQSPAELVAAVQHPNLKALREVAEVEPEALPALVATGAPITTLHIGWNPEFTLTAGALKALPKLQKVSFTFSQFDRIAPGLGALQELSIQIHHGEEVAAIWSRLELLPVVAVRLSRYDCDVLLTRAVPGGPFTTARFLVAYRLEELLPQLPASLTALTIDGWPRLALPKAALAVLEPVLSRFPLLKRQELPFEEQVEQPQVPHVTVSMSGVAFFEVPKLAPLMKILTEDFGVPFDSFDARGDLDLGDDAVAKLTTWVNNKRCRGVRIKVRGTKTELSLHREEGYYTSAELPLGDPQRFCRALEKLLEFARPRYFRVVNGKAMFTVEQMSEFEGRREELRAFFNGQSP